MGYFREKNREGVKEMRENSGETTELGESMREQADRINAVLESIVLQDDEDIQAIRETGSSYQRSFDSTFSEQVESAGREIEQQGMQIKENVECERENVSSGISKLEQASNISEIGRNAAEKGQSMLEGSAREYEGIISDAGETVDETKKQIEDLRNNLSKIFW